MDTISAQKTNAIFVQIASDTAERIENGRQRREEMLQAQKRGEPVVGYRADWIDNTALRIADVLAEAALEFNENNPDDMIAGEDLQDVLSTVAFRLRNVDG